MATMARQDIGKILARPIYQSPVDDAEAALKTAIDLLNGEDLPFLNYFDTPKITQENMSEFTKPVF